MTEVADPARSTAAAAAIRHHYDIGDDFYRLWLDDSLSYSCAMPVTPQDTLAAAQDRKLRHHLTAVGADRAESLLDIGCGWGAILARGSGEHDIARLVGLTLSDAQAEHVRARQLPGVRVHTQDWVHFEPSAPFDAIISIGAFEHFARPDDTRAEKIAVYREFFTRCRDWLTADGVLSLQTIAYANMRAENASTFMQREIFPDADLPTLAEITTAAEGLFEFRSLTDDRLDYAWTCQQWSRRLRARRAAAVDLVGPDTVARYERYLKLSALGFRMGKLGLLRIVARPYRPTFFARRDPR